MCTDRVSSTCKHLTLNWQVNKHTIVTVEYNGAMCTSVPVCFQYTRWIVHLKESGYRMRQAWLWLLNSSLCIHHAKSKNVRWELSVVIKTQIYSKQMFKYSCIKVLCNSVLRNETNRTLYMQSSKPLVGDRAALSVDWQRIWELRMDYNDFSW